MIREGRLVKAIIREGRLVKAIKGSSKSIIVGEYYKVLNVSPYYIRVKLNGFHHEFSLDSFESYFGPIKNYTIPKLNRSVKIL